MDNNQKVELVITALQEKIGQMAAAYETQIAFLRAEITMLMNEKEEKQNAVDKYNEELSAKTAVNN